MSQPRSTAYDPVISDKRALNSSMSQTQTPTSLHPISQNQSHSTNDILFTQPTIPSAAAAAANSPPPGAAALRKSKILIPPPPVASSRYNRQLLIPSISLAGQTRLSSAKILLVGLGGLGSPAALYLAGTGVHTLGFVDADVVETSNLHRQIVHREDSVRSGCSKVASAIRGCKELNSEVNYVGHELRLDVGNVLDVLRPYDLVLDCTDNPATRYLISDACVLLGKVLVSGAAQRLEGQLMVLNCPPTPTPIPTPAPNATTTTNISASSSSSPPQTDNAAIHDKVVKEKGPCYRCIFPRPPSPEMVRGCSEIGILGTVVGTIGVLMAGEAIRIVVQGAAAAADRKPNMLLYNAWSADPRAMFRSVGLRGRRKDCLVCGDNDVLQDKNLERITIESFTDGQRLDYVAFCGVVEDVKLLGDKYRIDAVDFLRLLRAKDGDETVKKEKNAATDQAVVVDVREENEFALGVKVKGSVNIPISKILRSGTTTTTAFEQLMATTTIPGDKFIPQSRQRPPIYFVCERGNDSQIAAQKLMDLRQREYEDSGDEGGKGLRRGWIGDVRGGFVEMERVERSADLPT